MDGSLLSSEGSFRMLSFPDEREDYTRGREMDGSLLSNEGSFRMLLFPNKVFVVEMERN
jgi:hypothetical protein